MLIYLFHRSVQYIFAGKISLKEVIYTSIRNKNSMVVK